MNSSPLSLVTSSDALLAIGVSLVMAGVFLRGFARNARREQERRRQHRLSERRSDDAKINAQLDRPPSWLERNYGRIANALLLTGALFAVASVVRH